VPSLEVGSFWLYWIAVSKSPLDEHCYHKCMPIGSVCCADGTGTFCLAGQYCTTGDDGVPSCCRNNDICFGPGSISTTTQFKTGTGTATFTDTDPIVPHKTQTTSDTFFVTHSTINDTFFVTNSPITETEVPSQVSSGFGPTRVATFTDKTTEAAATSQPVTFTGGAIWDAVPLRAVAVAAVVGVFGAWLV